MFCSQCGKEASGRFCSSCGHKLQEEHARLSQYRTYKSLMQDERAKAALAEESHKGGDFRVSLDTFFKVADKVNPLPIGLGTFTDIAAPITVGLGIKTGKAQDRLVQGAFGHVLLAVACHLARNGMEVQRVQEEPGRCVLEALLPSSMWTLKGRLGITLAEEGAATRLAAATHIGGQMFDWGRSKRELGSLFDAVERLVPAFQQRGL